MAFIKPESPDSFTDVILAERERQERNKYPSQEIVDKCILLINDHFWECVKNRQQVRGYFEVQRCLILKNLEPYISIEKNGLRVIYVPTDAYPNVYYEILGDVLRDKFVEAGWVFDNADFRQSVRAFEIIHPLHIRPSLWSRFKKWFRRQK